MQYETLILNDADNRSYFPKIIATQTFAVYTFIVFINILKSLQFHFSLQF